MYYFMPQNNDINAHSNRIDPHLTPVMVHIFLQKVDDYCHMPNTDISDLVMEFKEFERLSIEGLYDRVFKRHPLNAMDKMETITDARRTKIKGIVHKK